MAITTTQVKFMRQSLNKIEKGIEKIPSSREVALSKTALQESIMFLGLVLGDINEEATPYTESENKDSEKIEARADVSDRDYNFDAETHIGQVKELRADLAEKIEEMKRLYMEAPDTRILVAPQFFPTHLITAITNLERSKLWLGMELNRILHEKLKAGVELMHGKDLTPGPGPRIS